MKSIIRHRAFALALAFLLITGIFAGGVYTGYAARSAHAAEEPAQFGLFWEAWDIVDQFFVDQDKIDPQKMTYGAIQGMLDSLGDVGHTVFFSPEEAKAQEEAMEGSFEGIGAYVDSRDGLIVIVAPIHGSPAEAAGILAGDIVVAVDGQDVTGMDQSEVVSLIRGPAGTSVTVSVIHPEQEEPVDIEIVRSEIKIDSVLWAPVPGTDYVYLQLTQFAADTGAELDAALKEINNLDPAGIILDLRNNPGGYLQEALKVGNEFLPRSAVILHQRDAKQEITTFRSRGRGDAEDIPMVVLINPGSASAAEIIAGALQENDRARLVGENTLGTGTVLQPFTLSDGSVIRLGVTNWLTPDHHLIKGEGVHPDVVVEQGPSVEMIDAVILGDMTPEELAASEDRQFAEALELLRTAPPADTSTAASPDN